MNTPLIHHDGSRIEPVLMPEPAPVSGCPTKEQDCREEDNGGLWKGLMDHRKQELSRTYKDEDQGSAGMDREKLRQCRSDIAERESLATATGWERLSQELTATRKAVTMAALLADFEDHSLLVHEMNATWDAIREAAARAATVACLLSVEGGPA